MVCSKRKMDIDRHGPRQMPNNCQHLDPPNVSLPTTFNTQNCIGAVALLSGGRGGRTGAFSRWEHEFGLLAIIFIRIDTSLTYHSHI
jgi:hypothetical protein